jgi:hypothetical protein
MLVMSEWHVITAGEDGTVFMLEVRSKDIKPKKGLIDNSLYADLDQVGLLVCNGVDDVTGYCAQSRHWRKEWLHREVESEIWWTEYASWISSETQRNESCWGMNALLLVGWQVVENERSTREL